MRLKRIPFLLFQLHMLLHCLAEVGVVEVGVNLGCEDVFVTEQFLHLADIGSARQQMGGEGVAEGVRAYLLVNARTQGRLLYNGEYHHTRKARSTIIQKQSILALRLWLAQLLVL